MAWCDWSETRHPNNIMSIPDLRSLRALITDLPQRHTCSDSLSTGFFAAYSTAAWEEEPSL
jgi:hypothetical protein